MDDLFEYMEQQEKKWDAWQKELKQMDEKYKEMMENWTPNHNWQKEVNS
jgi:hypothetical protein